MVGMSAPTVVNMLCARTGWLHFTDEDAGPLRGHAATGQPALTGVEALRVPGGNAARRAIATHEVAAATGSIGSPQFLQHSGIGSADLRPRHGNANSPALRIVERAPERIAGDVQ